MNKEIRLSRLSITGPLDRYTPKIVLEEIAIAHRVPYPELLDTDENYIVHDDYLKKLQKSGRRQPQIDPDNIAEKDWPNLVSFVNRHVEWMTDSLLEAFTTLKIYMKEEAPLPGANFPYGPQIPANTGRLNACVLYKICKYYSLPLRFHHTIDQMASAVQMIVRGEPSRSFLKNQINMVHSDYLPVLYLHACNYMDTECEEDTENVEDMEDVEDTEEGPSQPRTEHYEDMELALEVFDNIEETLLRIKPFNAGEAIVLAAKNFKVDLTTCQAPIHEYYNLLKNRSAWVPLDPGMKKVWKMNPLAFQIDVYFNPRVPHQLYHRNDLIQLALNEGYTLQDLRVEGAFSLLATARLSPTFYHGKYPTIANSHTPIFLKRVRKLSPNSVICFGVCDSQLTAFDYDELAEQIIRSRSFINPIDKDGHSFSDVAIRKLKILSKVIRGGETKRELQKRKKLMRAIELGELFTEEINAKLRDFYLYYEGLCPGDKVKVHNTLQSFFRLAMFTRGWDPDNDEVYPIEIALVSNQNDVDVRVTEGINIFENLCEEYGEIGTKILDLPLVRYRDGWQMSTNVTQGTTIRERLDILKNGEGHQNHNSCMRLTSNWFAASVYRYMLVIGLDPPFDVEKLRSIS